MTAMSNLLDPNNPLFFAAVVPLCAALAATGLIRLLGGTDRGAGLAVVGAGIGFLIAYFLVFGAPIYPPRASTHKMPYLAVAGVLIGFALDALRPAPAVVRGAMLAWLAVGILWLAESLLRRGGIVLPVAVTAGALIAGWRLARQDSQTLAAPLMILTMALGLSGIAFIAASASIAQIAAALAAALGGYMLWNWPKFRFPFGAAGVLGIGATAIFLGGQMALYTRADKWALAVLLLVPFADIAFRRIAPGQGTVGNITAPVIIGIACAVPAIAAVAIAHFMHSGGSIGY